MWFLRLTVVGISSDSNPVIQITTAGYSFNGFVTASRENSKLQEDKKKGVKNPFNQVNFIKYTLYQQYGRNPSSFHKCQPKSGNYPRN